MKWVLWFAGRFVSGIGAAVLAIFWAAWQGVKGRWDDWFEE